MAITTHISMLVSLNVTWYSGNRHTVPQDPTWWETTGIIARHNYGAYKFRINTRFQ
jgi:hypothetical protein